ncbi:ketoacyl-ACP synthase III family protein [Kitasatospora sp. NPDC096077]|uniref:ketoacyl-ACP synthase III family protein n=1 Tax=Kitasatospora sp. NPDC096077 TaxID=3155544 RepID=UPI0033251610
MRWENVNISSAAAWLGRFEDVRTAVEQGRYDAEEAEADGYLGVRVTDTGSPADMAVTAGRTALARVADQIPHVELLMHASFGFQGIDHWSPAAYIEQRTVGGSASAMEVKQASTGGLAALHLAAAHVTAGSPTSSVLVTTADAYRLPVFERYGADDGVLRADGASALVVTRQEGVARVLSTVLCGDTTHEAIHRGDEQWSDVAGSSGWPVDLRHRKQQYFDRTGLAGRDVGMALIQGTQKALHQALDEAGTRPDEIARFVFPNLSLPAQRMMYQWEANGIDESRTTWGWGRGVGHIAAGDQAAGLAHLLETRAVRVGDRVVLCGTGSGFSFAAAVLEITAVPDWSVSSE